MALKELPLYVYNTSFTLVSIIDRYSSLIWSDRYDECGDFELVMPYQQSLKSIFKQNYYCKIEYSDRWMIIEELEIKYDEEDPPQFTVKGRSLESILERRIVLEKTEFGDDKKDVSVQDSIKKLLNENVISPKDTKRKISNFKFEASTDKAVTDLKFSDTYDKDEIYGVIEDICQDKHIGFKVLLNSSNQFVFSLYAGRDRSKATNTTSYVIFSHYYDNLKNSTYFSTIEEHRNLMYISKDEKKYLTAYTSSNEPTGLSRRECHEDLNTFKENKSIELKDKEVITKAKKKLKEEFKIKTGFDGEIDPDIMYTYRSSYNVGDKVQFEDAYGNSETLYISEVVISYDDEGLVILPTFKEIDWS